MARARQPEGRAIAERTVLRERRDGTLAAKRPRNRLRVAGIAAGTVVVLAITSQLLLPPLAEWRLRSNLQRNADGVKVEVSAFPAIQILLGRADRAEVSIDSARSSGGGKLGDALGEARRAEEVDVRIDRLTSHGLLMRDVTLTKRDDRLVGGAVVLRKDLAAALPPGIEVRARDAGAGGIVLRGSIDALGVKGSARFRIVVRGGGIVIEPIGGGLASLVTFTVFRDDHVRVDSMKQTSSRGHYTFTATGHIED